MKDAAPCENNPQYKAVNDAYHQQESLVKKAYHDPDWQLKASKAVFPHMKEVKQNFKDFQAKWNAGDYYGSGQAVGNVDKIVFAPWNKGYYASDSGVPATAPADFQAGVLDAMFGTDLRAQMNECFLPDQTLADNTTALIADITDKDWSAALDLVKQFEAEALTDAAPCENNPQYQDVNDAYHEQQDLVKTAMADPDWQVKATKAVLPHMKAVKQNIADFKTKWAAGDYYGSGQAIGKIDQIVFKPWSIYLF